MQFISINQVADDLRSIFSTDMPTALRCFAILSGDAAGRILVDDSDRPSAAMVQEMAEGSVYLSTSVNSKMFSEAMPLLRQEQDVVIGWWHDDPRWSWLSEAPEYDGVAIDFTDRAGDLRRHVQVPPHCRLQTVDAQLFQRLPGHEWTEQIFGSAERALEKGLGYCLMQDDEILCEAFAGPAANGAIELGVGTDESYRGRGYATITCAHLIDVCEAKGYRTFWNTSQQNAASIALARKLGYRTEQAFRVVAWSKLN